MKVNMTAEQVIKFAPVAKSNGTQDAYINIAVEWIMQAAVYMKKLEEENAELRKPKLYPETEGYVQPVPDRCDRINWRGKYHHLHE